MVLMRSWVVNVEDRRPSIGRRRCRSPLCLLHRSCLTINHSLSVTLKLSHYHNFSFAVTICRLLMLTNIPFNSVLLPHNSFLLFCMLSVLAVFGLNSNNNWLITKFTDCLFFATFYQHNLSHHLSLSSEMTLLPADLEQTSLKLTEHCLNCVDEVCFGRHDGQYQSPSGIFWVHTDRQTHRHVIEQSINQSMNPGIDWSIEWLIHPSINHSALLAELLQG